LLFVSFHFILLLQISFISCQQVPLEASKKKNFFKLFSASRESRIFASPARALRGVFAHNASVFILMDGNQNKHIFLAAQICLIDCLPSPLPLPS